MDLTYLSNVNESTHQALIAEGGNSVLCLFSCSIFHNSMILISQGLGINGVVRLTRIPTRPRTEVQTVNPKFQQNRRGEPGEDQ